MLSHLPRALQQHGSSNLAIVKINRPSAHRVLPRERLFDLLDDYRSLPVTWIAAPAGSGKTTLVASYLTSRQPAALWYQCDPGDKDIASFFYYLGLAALKVQSPDSPPLPPLTTEYQNDINAFARGYFQELFFRMAPGSVIVFDNCQEIDSNCQLPELLAKACEAIPEGLRCIFISRSNPPPAMARLQLHKRLGQIEAEQLRLTREESRDIVTSYSKVAISQVAVDKLHNQFQGWVAGLILVMSRKKGQVLQPEAASRASNEIIFDYFAGEIFEGASDQTKELLLSTAFLPEFTGDMAQEISGNIHSEKILGWLLRKNFFITEHSDATYQYHPLFREFLANRAEKLMNAADLAKTMRRSAELLLKASRREEAAALLKKSGNHQALIHLIRQAAPSMVLEGRGQTLQSWLEGIPLAQQEKNPWLLYWAGVCLLPFNQLQAQAHFNRAFVGFREQGDVPGIFSAWCGVVEAILHELGNLSGLDPWIRILDQILADRSSPLPPLQDNQIAASMFISLAFRQPDHPRFSFWKEKALAGLSQEKNPSLRMITGFYLLSYSYWIGELGTAGRVLKEIAAMAGSRQASPLARLTGYLAVSWHGWMEGNHKISLRAVTDGLDFSAKSGVVLWNYLLSLQGVVNALSQGDADGADIWLNKLAVNLPKARGMDIFYYHHERAWQSLLRGRMQESLAHQQTALAKAREVGALPVIGQVHFGISQIYHENSMIPERNHHLAECRRLADLCQSRILEFMARIAEAHYALGDGDQERIKPLLADAMALGRAHGYCNFTFWRSSVMTPLCIRALEENIEVEYVQQLIIKRGLQPQHPQLGLDSWPWPLRIYTLGRFSVEKNGQALVFGKKAQTKILELLKALIAFGGQEVSEDLLSDTLWPDSDGDAAHQALATALFRLRKWLGVKNVLSRSEGRISLDPCFCWVDCWAFERLLEQSAQTAPGGDGRQGFLTRATEIYHGHFLAGDADKSWATLMRERLRSKMVCAIKAMADSLAAEGQYQKLITCYRQGIEIDPLAEEFYQGLMHCYSTAGEIGQAMQVYENLTTVLAAAFAVKPSETSQAIYRSLR